MMPSRRMRLWQYIARTPTCTVSRKPSRRLYAVSLKQERVALTRGWDCALIGQRSASNVLDNWTLETKLFGLSAVIGQWLVDAICTATLLHKKQAAKGITGNNQAYGSASV